MAHIAAACQAQAAANLISQSSDKQIGSNMPEGAEMFSLVDALFGCRHKHCMFPITIRQPHSNQATNPPTYIVCLDCGKEFGYDWQKMKVGATVKHAA